jgi:hypothetical protein
MAKTLVAFPVLPGKEAMASQELPDYSRAHPEEYEESRKNAGITLERVYDQPTPMGTFNVLYGEGASDFASATQILMTSGTEFDNYFKSKIQEITGIDFSTPPQGPPPEIIGDWWDPDVKERRAGLAFCAPLLPGKVDAGRALIQEAFVARNAEMTESRRALGQNGEVIGLNYTPMGEIAVVYLEGNDPVEGNRGFAASQSPFDRWFKDELKGILAPEINPDEPIPAGRQIFDWSAGAVPAR